MEKPKVRQKNHDKKVAQQDLIKAIQKRMEISILFYYPNIHEYVLYDTEKLFLKDSLSLSISFSEEPNLLLTFL